MNGSTYLNDEARSYIEEIRKTKDRMKSRFEDFNDTMKKLSSGNAFVGSAGTTFFQKYDVLKRNIHILKIYLNLLQKILNNLLKQLKQQIKLLNKQYLKYHK